jgi:hypothetical protein
MRASLKINALLGGLAGAGRVCSHRMELRSTSKQRAARGGGALPLRTREARHSVGLCYSHRGYPAADPWVPIRPPFQGSWRPPPPQCSPRADHISEIYAERKRLRDSGECRRRSALCLLWRLWLRGARL